MTAPDIQEEIQRTRERLGETVDELAARADMKARARDKAAELSGRVRQSRLAQRRWPLAVAAGVLVAGSVVIWRRRRS
jgi:formate-dependent nitrite reductase cytochrome c552 subunit